MTNSSMQFDLLYDADKGFEDIEFHHLSMISVILNSRITGVVFGINSRTQLFKNEIEKTLFYKELI